MRNTDKKSIKQLKELGYATFGSQGDNDSENPEEWRVLSIWVQTGQQDLMLDYEWRKDKYHFYLPDKREESMEHRPKTVGSLDVYNVKEFLNDKFPHFAFAEKVANIVNKDNLFVTNNPEEIAIFEGEDFNEFSALIYWFVENSDNSFAAFNKTKGIYIFGDYSEALQKIKSLGYTIPEDEFGDPDLESLEDFITTFN